MSLFLRGEIWHSRIEVGGKAYRFTTHCTNKNKARDVEADKRTNIREGKAEAADLVHRSPVFSKFAEDVPGILKGQVNSADSLSFYLCHLKALLLYEPLRDCRLELIDTALIQDFTSWRMTNGKKEKGVYSVSTVNHALRTLRRVLHLAKSRGLIEKVPVIKLRRGEVERTYVISDADIARFAERYPAANPPDSVSGLSEATQAEQELISKIVPLLCDTGLRRSELIHLEWPNVLATHLNITKSKTPKGLRRIPLTPRARAILDSLPHDSQYVFSLFGGKPLTGNWVTQSFRRARRGLKLPDACVLHSTRHTFCSRLGDAGVNAKQIMELAGHSSLEIAQKYIHATGLDAAIAKLG